MKKMLCLTAALACLLCGCAKKPPSGDIYTLYLNGKAVNGPVTVESLGSDYNVDLGFVLTYKDESVAGIVFDEDSAEEDDRKKPIEALVGSQIATPDWNDFSVGGIVLGKSEQDVLDVFGEPTVKDDVSDKWTYSKIGRSEDDYYLGFVFDDNGKVKSIYFRFDK